MDIIRPMEQRFQEVTKMFNAGSDRWMIVFVDDTVLCCILTPLEQVAGKVAGLVDFYSAIRTKHTDIQKDVLQQVARFKTIVEIEYEVDAYRRRTNFIVNTLFDVAADVNGYILYPGMSLYDSKGIVFFTASGESQYEAYRQEPLPADTPPDIPPPGDTDLCRKQRSVARLREAGVPYMEQLPILVPDNEARPRAPREIARRATALFALGLYSEVLLSDNQDREEALEYLRNLEKNYDISDEFTPAERAYLDNPTPEQPECIRFLWRYECCAALLWALGIVELSYPSGICDVPFIARLFLEHQEEGTILGLAAPRERAEILDEADLAMRYDWACVDARVNGKEAPASLDAGVVMERHYAFNWLVGANEGAGWDDVRLDT